MNHNQNEAPDSELIPSEPVLRVSLFGPVRLHWLVPTKSDEDAWHRRTSACALFCLLLCAPQRRASRSQLAAALWPEVDEPRAIESLRVATRALRTVLHPASGEALLHSFPGGLLQLADQSRMEVDVDTFEALIQQASTSNDEDEALAIWERARALVCGEFLADHVRGSEWSTHRWIKIRQRDLHAARRRMICALADGSIQRGQLVQAELLLQGHVNRFPGDQDAVFRLVKLLIADERLGEARESYQRCKAVLASSGKEPAEHLKALIEHLSGPHASDTWEDASIKPMRHRQQRCVPSLANSISPFDQIIEANTPYTRFFSILRQESGHAQEAMRTEEEETFSPMATASYVQKHLRDISSYRKNVRSALYLHRTNTAQGLLHSINADRHDLQWLESQTKGYDLYQIREILISDDLLAAKIVKDQRNYTLAYHYADHAVQLATSLEDGELIATTKYTRGCIQLEWAQFGTVKQMRLQLDAQKVKDALSDFQDVLQATHSRYLSLHPQLQGFTMLQLSRALSLLPYHRDQYFRTHPLAFADQAETFAGCHPVDDAYTRLLTTGTLSGLHTGGYHLVKAGIFNVAGFPDQALTELVHLERLTQQTYAPDETRNAAWYTITMAETLMGLKRYQEALHEAKKALITCSSINSIQNVTMILPIYSQIAASSYGKSPEVKELADMLQKWYGESHDHDTNDEA